MKQRSRIAIGWTGVGDLSKAEISGQSDIATLISKAHHKIKNAHLGGPSLWNLYHHMQEGDLVILNAPRKRVCVLEVIGPYIYESASGQIKGYGHQRPACLTSLDPKDLWDSSGAAVASGQNIRWTLAACIELPGAKSAIYKEGARYSVTSTAIERNPLARAACINHHGCKCNVCGFDFEAVFGELGKGYIHVHHRVEISTNSSEHQVNPVEDLIPLCPNCHAMAHQKRPPVPVENLKEMYRNRIRIKS
ncbi:MAG: HNH endonuclease [Paucibacter sp.]|nr:HNH endonuclease [Roseateles sp.]